MRYTLIARFLLRIAIIFGLPCVAAAETPLTNEQITNNFNTIAFGNEYTKQQYGHVRKWEKPIYVGILGKPPDSFDDMVVQFSGGINCRNRPSDAAGLFATHCLRKADAKGFLL